MKQPAAKRLALCSLVFLSLFSMPPVAAELPKRDLRVELRQVADSEGAGYAVSTQASQPLAVAQSVQVRNGEKASLSVNNAMPMQWVQSVAGQSASLATAGTTASSSGGTVNNAIIWMDMGQSIKVQPRWPGAKQLVKVEIEMQSANVDERIGAELPNQSRHQLATTVSVPLGQWVTIAASGSRPQRGVYGSEPVSDARRLLQIRVLAE